MPQKGLIQGLSKYEFIISSLGCIQQNKHNRQLYRTCVSSNMFSNCYQKDATKKDAVVRGTTLTLTKKL